MRKEHTHLSGFGSLNNKNLLAISSSHISKNGIAISIMEVTYITA